MVSGFLVCQLMFCSRCNILMCYYFLVHISRCNILMCYYFPVHISRCNILMCYYFPVHISRCNILMCYYFPVHISRCNILMCYYFPVHIRGIIKRIPICVCPRVVQYTHHLACNAQCVDGRTEWDKSLHLHVWGGVILYN